MAKSNKRNNQKSEKDIIRQNFMDGCEIIRKNSLFSPLYTKAEIYHNEEMRYPNNGFAAVTENGYVFCHPKLRAEPKQWARVIAHCLLHLAMGHFQKKERPVEWNIACDFVVEKFLRDFNFGSPFYFGTLPQDNTNDEEKLYYRLCEMADKTDYIGLGTAGPNAPDMIFGYESHYRYYGNPPQWSKLFASGLSNAVRSAVDKAAGIDDGNNSNATSAANRAKEWFISNYPLLGAVAAGFKIIENWEVCQRMEIAIAAVSPSLSEIYINPGARLNSEELRFVMAHEFLHAALCHNERQEWRDAYLWNVACDFVINQWLTEMHIGERPDGLLYDEQFKGLNAEAIYDRIVGDIRTYRKLATLRGVGLGDILPGERGGKSGDVDLDDFYRRALSQGLQYHQQQGRGYLPAGLIEEIYALSHPPIPWDVELARWFDEQFTPIEKVRTYARPSRRQSSTPDIPRPNWIISKAALDGRTFGVILDTSGSMERGLLASALGAIASYSAARDVPAARIIFCDAAAYDAGYMKPEDAAGSVKVKGRGGTILQPGIDLLEQADDFPKEAPILIITDAECDKVILYGREHAFLIPHGATLPFVPKGKVFRMK